MTKQTEKIKQLRREVVVMRMEKGLKDKIRELAEESSRNITMQINYMLKEQIKQRENLK